MARRVRRSASFLALPVTQSLTRTASAHWSADDFAAASDAIADQLRDAQDLLRAFGLIAALDVPDTQAMSAVALQASILIDCATMAMPELLARLWRAQV